MRKHLIQPLLALPRPVKRALALVMDMSLCVLAVWLALSLRMEEWVRLQGVYWWAVAGSVVLALPLFVLHGLYRAIFRYSGWPAMLAVARAMGLYGLLYATIFTAIGIDGIPRTIGITQPVILLLLVGASRAFVRLWLGEEYRSLLHRSSRPKVLIYGAGRAGRQLATALSGSHEMQVMGFLDDDDRLHGHTLNSLPIYRPEDLPHLVSTLGIRDVLLAMPSIGRRRRNEILSQISQSQVAVRTLPSVTELAQGKVSVSNLRDLDIDDLLGREPVQPNHLLLAKSIAGKIVLVTGAGGSIGSELCRQILGIGPKKLLLVDHSEFALYAIHQELSEKLDGRKIELIPLLASVVNEARMRKIMGAWHPDTVYHAAAYKHVPLVEHNPVEGLRNNVFGTLITARAAAACGVADFVLVSTDKAVRPTNVMGASKRLAEMTLQALTEVDPTTRFSIVRFGNVLDSSGSVVPKFRRQIRDGGPITITHPEVTRYFMTIPEAAQLVIQAGAMAKGGEVFVLDMGQPVKIADLARRMVELSGLTIKDAQNPNGDIEITFIGLRPGEKLYEELLIGDDPHPTSHPRIMKAHECFIPWAQLQSGLNALEAALDSSDIRLTRALLQGLVPGYTPCDRIVDWLHLEQDGSMNKIAMNS